MLICGSIFELTDTLKANGRKDEGKDLDMMGTVRLELGIFIYRTEQEFRQSDVKNFLVMFYILCQKMGSRVSKNFVMPKQVINSGIFFLRMRSSISHSQKSQKNASIQIALNSTGS